MKRKQSQRPILVPVDFSAHSRAALLKAGELAECSGQPLLVLHVIHDPANMPGYYGQVAKKKKLVRIEDLARETFEKFLRKIRRQNPAVKPLADAKTQMVLGLPVTRILEISEQSGASMIVMGSQGRTGLEHLMLGSKAEQVLHLSKIPVTIVKGEFEPA